MIGAMMEALDEAMTETARIILMGRDDLMLRCFY